MCHAHRLGLLVLVALAACSKPPGEVPKELLGTWVTDAPTHADRTFVIRPDAVVFGTGAYSRENYSLADIEAMEPAEGWKPYRLSIRELDAEISSIEVAYRTGATPELRFRNRSEIWRPEGSIPDPAKAVPTQKKNWTDAWMARERGNG
jgi:hypothetical protein